MCSSYAFGDTLKNHFIMPAPSMQIRLSPPEHWPVHDQADGSVRVVIPGHAEGPDLWLVYGPLQPLPLDRRRWVQTAPLRVDSSTQTVTLEHSEATQTTLGWPLWLASVRITNRTSPAEPSEAAAPQETWLRLHALYQFLEYSAEVVVTAATQERWLAHRDAILSVLRGAEPDFRGPDVVALSELWATAQDDSRRR